VCRSPANQSVPYNVPQIGQNIHLSRSLCDPMAHNVLNKHTIRVPLYDWPSRTVVLIYFSFPSPSIEPGPYLFPPAERVERRIQYWRWREDGGASNGRKTRGHLPSARADCAGGHLRAARSASASAATSAPRRPPPAPAATSAPPRPPCCRAGGHLAPPRPRPCTLETHERDTASPPDFLRAAHLARPPPSPANELRSTALPAAANFFC
jgi:hypothetical protein